MQVELTAEQLRVLADWSEAGVGFVAVTIHGTPPPYVQVWAGGDVLAEQGDAYVQVSEKGVIRDAVPPTRLGIDRAPLSGA